MEIAQRTSEKQERTDTAQPSWKQNIAQVCAWDTDFQYALPGMAKTKLLPQPKVVLQFLFSDRKIHP